MNYLDIKNELPQNEINFPDWKEKDIWTIIKEVEHTKKSKVISCEKLSEGKVHHIYRLIFENKERLILKKRSSSFSTNFQIKINPFDISFEEKAILSLQKKVINSPKILFFSKSDCYLCLEDLENEGYLSINSLMEDEFIILLISVFLRDFYSLTKTIDINIRGKREEIFYFNNLFYRIGFLNTQYSDTILNTLSSYPKQIIHGDLTPMNLFYNSSNGNIKLIDFETIHKGNVIFDLAFFLSHLILRNFKNKEKMYKLIMLFFTGFGSIKRYDEENIIVPITMFLILYRIESVFTYHISIDDKIFLKSIITKCIDCNVNNFNEFTNLL